MSQTTVTLTLPNELYKRSQQLVEIGLFADLEDVVRAGLRYVLLEATLLQEELPPPGLTDGERCKYYIEKLRRQIRESGGLFPGKSKEEVIDILRLTRNQIYEEKYAAHFRRE